MSYLSPMNCYALICWAGDTIRDDLVCPQPFLPPNGCCWWLLSSAGKAAGCRILVALERNHPDIAFCPDLQPLAAILLHVLDDESECYEVLSSIVEADNTGPCSFLDQSQAAFSASQLSLGQVARQKAVSQRIKSSCLLSSVACAGRCSLEAWKPLQSFP